MYSVPSVFQTAIARQRGILFDRHVGHESQTAGVSAHGNYYDDTARKSNKALTPAVRHLFQWLQSESLVSLNFLNNIQIYLFHLNSLI